jgi:hypothetical protein
METELTSLGMVIFIKDSIDLENLMALVSINGKMEVFT